MLRHGIGCCSYENEKRLCCHDLAWGDESVWQVTENQYGSYYTFQIPTGDEFSVSDVICTTLSISKRKDYSPRVIEENIKSHSPEVIASRTAEAHFLWQWTGKPSSDAAASPATGAPRSAHP